jgi:hypothetical protein
MAERQQIKMLQTLDNRRRFRLASELSATTRMLARRAIKRANPTLSEEEIDILFVRYHYGADLADRLHLFLKNRAHGPL